MALLRPFTRYSLTLLALVMAADAAGQRAPALPELLRGIDRLGIALAEQLWQRTPDRNMAVAPASVAVLLTAIQHSTLDPAVNREIGELLGTTQESTRVAARMLLAGLPELPPLEPSSPYRSLNRPEGAWMRNRLRHRGEGTLSDRFLASAVDFRISIESTGTKKPSQIDQDRQATMMRPDNDLLFSSSTHLRTGWAGNTFALSTPFSGTFTSASGTLRTVQMLSSEVESYLHARTELFEAAVLPGNTASLLVAVPNHERTINDLVAALQRDDVRRAMAPQVGSVDLPPFTFSSNVELRPMLEQLGIRTPFVNLDGIARIRNSHLTEINQSMTVTVDRIGMRADAEVVGGEVYGGVLSAQNPFHMRLDRPFIFMIRDNATDALLFVGIVADPTMS